MAREGNFPLAFDIHDVPDIVDAKDTRTMTEKSRAKWQESDVTYVIDQFNLLMREGNTRKEVPH
jgi:hypothetical protein